MSKNNVIQQKKSGARRPAFVVLTCFDDEKHNKDKALSRTAFSKLNSCPVMVLIMTFQIFTLFTNSKQNMAQTWQHVYVLCT